MLHQDLDDSIDEKKFTQRIHSKHSYITVNVKIIGYHVGSKLGFQWNSVCLGRIWNKY